MTPTIDAGPNGDEQQTQNPQAAPAELFPQASGLQTSNQSEVLEQPGVTIQVPTNPAAPSTPAPVPPAYNWLPFAALAVALLIAAWLVSRLGRGPAVQPAVIEEPVPQPLSRIERPAPKPRKKTPKKSKSKRKHR